MQALRLVVRFSSSSMVVSVAAVAGLSAVAQSALAEQHTPAARSQQAPEPLTTRGPLVKVDPVAVQMRDDAARQLYLIGRQAYRDKRFDQALMAYQKAHRIEKLPALLFEMAACHGRMGQMREAFAVHRHYVESFRDPVERLVAAARFGEIMRRVREAAKTKTVKMSKAP